VPYLARGAKEAVISGVPLPQDQRGGLPGPGRPQRARHPMAAMLRARPGFSGAARERPGQRRVAAQRQDAAGAVAARQPRPGRREKYWPAVMTPRRSAHAGPVIATAGQCSGTQVVPTSQVGRAPSCPPHDPATKAATPNMRTDPPWTAPNVRLALPTLPLSSLRLSSPTCETCSQLSGFTPVGRDL
jgi:hypothetical protein